MFKPVNEQLEYLKKGCVEIIQEEELKAKLERALQTGRPLRVKAGFDPTAPDIHVGHTVLLRKMKHFQDLGHDVIFLVGDFTALIGDPSGRSAARPPMTRADIAKNAETYKSQIFKILSTETTIVDFNSRWLGALSSFEIINLSAKYTVARILERDDFSKRFREGLPISVHELLYPLMQAYDSVALKADVELGGTDQKFNLLVGREIQREFKLEPQIVMTMPLLEGLDGVEKMSKSLGNYIGITEPVGEIFGKIMSISDPLMFRYFELLTDVPVRRIEEWKSGIQAASINPRDLKIELARQIVRDFCGDAEAERAVADFDRIFKHKEIPADLQTVEIMEKPAATGPSAQKPAKLLVDVMMEMNVFPSRGEAKRTIQQGGVYLDGERVGDINCVLDISQPVEHILKVGKRKFYKFVVRVSSA